MRLFPYASVSSYASVSRYALRAMRYELMRYELCVISRQAVRGYTRVDPCITRVGSRTVSSGSCDQGQGQEAPPASMEGGARVSGIFHDTQSFKKSIQVFLYINLIF